jgi:uncharacterized protein (TIGR03067 family)
MRVFASILIVIGVVSLFGCSGDDREQNKIGEPFPRSSTNLRDGTAADTDKLVETDIAKLEGTWEATSVQYDGIEHPQHVGYRWVFAGTRYIAGFNEAELDMNRVENVGSYRVDPTKNPKEIDMVPPARATAAKGQIGKAIYSLEGNLLQLCIPNSGLPRPTSFSTSKDDGVALTILKRVQK